jgi:hypothetical protein
LFSGAHPAVLDIYESQKMRGDLVEKVGKFLAGLSSCKKSIVM